MPIPADYSSSWPLPSK